MQINNKAINNKQINLFEFLKVKKVELTLLTKKNQTN